jgi:flagellar hook-associated protein 3 FlgL
MTMSLSFVSTPYLANVLVQPVQQAQAQLATATTEASTGEYADLGLQLGDQSGYELSLKEKVQQLQTLTSGNSLVATNLSTAQDTLSTMSSSARSIAASLTSWMPGTGAGAQLATMGVSALQGLTALANATSGEIYVFGGINSSTAPLADYFSIPVSAARNAVYQAFLTTFGCLPTDPGAANITASQMQSFLSGPFAGLFSSANWTSNWSSASSVNTIAEIAPGQMATTSVNANAAGFQRLAQAYTMLAEFGGSQLSLSAQQAVASAALPLVTQGQSSLTDVRAGLGATQSQVTDANTAMSSQLTLVEQQVNSLDNVDQTAIAAKITSLTDEIQTAYDLTARLQTLNLAQYLPVP